MARGIIGEAGETEPPLRCQEWTGSAKRWEEGEAPVKGWVQVAKFTRSNEPGLGAGGKAPPNSHHTICWGCPGGQKRMCVGHSREDAGLPAASSLQSWWCNRPKAGPHAHSHQAEPRGPPSTHTKSHQMSCKP